MSLYPGIAPSAEPVNYLEKKCFLNCSGESQFVCSERHGSGQTPGDRLRFIKANASMDSLVEKEVVEDAEQYLDE